MTRLPGTVSGFIRPETPVASPCLTHAVAATLALGAVSLCLVVAITMLSIRVAMALPG